MAKRRAAMLRLPNSTGIKGASMGEVRDSDASIDALSDEFYRQMHEALRGRLPKKSRFRHSIGVAKQSEELAEIYGADVRKARLAGLLHDWDKGYDDEGIRVRAEELGLRFDPFLLEHMPQLLHGPTAAQALALEFPQIPPDVLSAIERHTAGAVGMSDLDMIVYIADVIEPHRDFDGVDKLRELVGAKPLEELFIDVSAHVLGNLVDRHRFIHPETLKVWNYYLMRQKRSS